MRALPLALLTACGPVGTPAPESPAEATARRAVVAALRVALAEACRATLPPVGAHPLHLVAHVVVCGPYPMPAAGVTLPLPLPPAPLSEVL